MLHVGLIVRLQGHTRMHYEACGEKILKRIFMYFSSTKYIDINVCHLVEVKHVTGSR